MDTRSRRLFSIAPLTLAVLLAACGSGGQTPAPAPSEAPSVEPGASASEVATSPAATAAASAAAVTQTDTEWGRIWDDVPPGFPRFPGSTPADGAIPDPVSATFSVANDDTAEIAAWMQGALETATFSTESLSGPLEDGSFVLESVGEGDCRIQVAVAPMGGLTFLIVRYGAACPNG
jgi:hypothetical protein